MARTRGRVVGNFHVQRTHIAAVELHVVATGENPAANLNVISIRFPGEPNVFIIYLLAYDSISRSRKI